MCLDGQSVTGIASGTPTNATEAYAHEFALTISTLLTCDVPLPAPCQANDDGLYGPQWDAFRVSCICLFRKSVSKLWRFLKLIHTISGRRMVASVCLKLCFNGLRIYAVLIPSL